MPPTGSVDVDGASLVIPPMTAHVDDVGGWLVVAPLSPVPALVPRGGRWVASMSLTGAKADLCRRILADPDRAENTRPRTGTTVPARYDHFVTIGDHDGPPVRGPPL